ncbi:MULTISPECIES: hypothetical protein [unclassified Streptomyces]|uniref:hypothetical protein n=1 Tax=unclassified Streptomyces TaxID=2593676 RepID=UPI000362A5A6|nr:MULTISPECIES: hypothetical protein [unclassified Streptomyces]MYQ79555.1 hypothetical protein [Streptomyces sp. SID4923]
MPRERRAARRALALAVAPCLALVLTAPAARADAGAGRAAACDQDRERCLDGRRLLYWYGYGLGVHPFTTPEAVRRQLTDNFRLFPVSGSCPGRVRTGDTCDLLGGNPVRVESAAGDHLQIATLPGHDLGNGLHIRFTFTRSLGFHYLDVAAWQDRETDCTRQVLCGAASRAGAWALWQVLAQTLTVSAWAA